jgi:short-subunit dehydrogenase
MAAYVASKHAVVGLSEALEAELRILGAPIGVTVVCPGWVRTGIFESGRNRPDALRHDTPLAPDLLVPVAEAFGDVLTTSIAPDDVAARVLEAIERDRFYAFTHPAQAPAVRERLRRIDAALDADAG